MDPLNNARCPDEFSSDILIQLLDPCTSEKRHANHSSYSLLKP